MAFWQTLTQEDQGTLMELLKEEQDETKPSDKSEHWANSLLKRIDRQRKLNEEEKAEKEKILETNALLSKQVLDQKDLQ